MDRLDAFVPAAAKGQPVTVQPPRSSHLSRTAELRRARPSTPPVGFVSQLRRATAHLAQYHGDAAKPVCLSVRGIERATTFLGVRAGLRPHLGDAQLRNAIGQLLGLHGTFELVQVIGDSAAPFSPLGQQMGRDALDRTIGANTAIEYGYTAKPGDANGLVNDHLLRHPERAAHALGNVVSDAIQAVDAWGCLATDQVRAFVLPYNEDGSPTHFGEDTWLSDGPMSGPMGDRMVCFEGGPQSVEQMVHALERDVPVIAYSGMRDEGRAAAFSAAELMLALARAHGQGDQDLGAKRDAYLSQHSPSRPEQTRTIRSCLDALLEDPIRRRSLALVVQGASS